MNIKATYIAPTIKVHILTYDNICGGLGQGGSTNPDGTDSKSSFADFGDPSDEAPSSSWDNSTY